MCGITGIYHYNNDKKVAADILRSMTDSLAHRGPDGHGYHVEDRIGLGHRRLSIIDLSTGDQPMYSAERDLVVVFNGEIYNYIELTKELSGLGHRFRTTSDTEVILHAYRQWGVECQNKFNGMWAFALWDFLQKRLFISRDRLGEKPLFYSDVSGTLLFGSEIKALFAGGFQREINDEILELYLSLSYIPAPFTGFKGIHKLKPGHCLLADRNGCKIHQYWKLPMVDEQDMNRNEQEVLSAFEELLSDSVRIRMRSDVPYGAFLSGGLDSGSIVSLMSGFSTKPIQTFTAGFVEKVFDESKAALQVAKKFRTIHHQVEVNAEFAINDIDLVQRHFDEPFGDSSAVPTGRIAQFARSNVKMVLTGDGGDEVLSGYPTYQFEKIFPSYQLIPGFMRTLLQQSLSVSSNLFRGLTRYRMNHLVQIMKTLNMPFSERLIYKLGAFDPKILPQLLHGRHQGIKLTDFLNDLYSSCPYTDPFYRRMFFDFSVSLPDDMLAKVDRMSMAHSLEARLPFLDHRLVEYMATVHKDIKLKSYATKHVLRATVARRLPAIVRRGLKKGFAAPTREWFKQENFLPIISQLESMDYGIDTAGMGLILKQHMQGTHDHGNLLWILLILLRGKMTSYPTAVS